LKKNHPKTKNIQQRAFDWTGIALVLLATDIAEECEYPRIPQAKVIKHHKYYCIIFICSLTNV